MPACNQSTHPRMGLAGVDSLEGSDRRRFLATVAGMATVAMPLAACPVARVIPPSRSCLWIHLVGGPSQIDTFDPKPAAPTGVRGPFRSLATSVPGVRLSELFPGLANRLGQVTLLRALHHPHLPTHEAGLLELHTGLQGVPLGTHLPGRNPQTGVPAWMVVPGPLEGLGLLANPLALGQDDSADQPWLAAAPPAGDLVRYGEGRVGRALLQARLGVEAGARLVTVNTAPTVFHQRTWDCHADGCSLTTTVEQTRDLGLKLDRALCALLDDLSARGLLESTLVVAVGEMGRTPHLNSRGGRDHWARAWSAVLAGGGRSGGEVIGKTDAWGGEPLDGAVRAGDLRRQVAEWLGLTGG